MYNLWCVHVYVCVHCLYICYCKYVLYICYCTYSSEMLFRYSYLVLLNFKYICKTKNHYMYILVIHYSIITIILYIAMLIILYSLPLPNGPQRDKTDLLTCAPNEDSNQPAHSRSLIRVFVVCMKRLYILGYPNCAQ